MMMLKLPKQHLLGLALALVGVGAFLGIHLSDVTNQHTYAWSSNNDYIEEDFWSNDRTPGNDAQLINALFGDGNGGGDSTFYTQRWTTNSCNIANISVQYINPGTDILPATLTGNTVYVLSTGVHNITTTRVFSGDCIALVGRRYTTQNGTGIAHLTMTGSTALSLSGNKNIIIEDIGLSVYGTAIGVDAYNIQSSSIGPQVGGNVSSMLGKFINPTNTLILGRWDGAYNANQTNLFISGGQDIRIGEYRPVVVSRRSQTGIAIYNTNDVIMYADAANNIGIGAYFQNVNNLQIYARYYNQNTSHGLVISGSNNVYIQGGSYGGDYTSNGGNGIYMYNVSSGTLKNVVSKSNAQNGIQLAYTTGVNIITSQFNQNTGDGIFLDAGVSTTLISGSTMSGNYIDGLSILNGANHNTIISSTIAQNRFNGINMNDVYNNILSGLTVSANISGGVLLWGPNVHDNTISYTQIYQTQAPGMVILQGYNNNIDHIISHDNQGVGIGLAAGLSNSTIAYSTSYNNIGYAGFAIDGLGSSPTNNILHDLYAYGNGTDGITTSNVGGSPNYIYNIYAYNNTQNGINLSTTTTDISGYNIYTYGNTLHGVSLDNASANNLSFIQSYNNGGDGLHLLSSNDNAILFAQLYANIGHGLGVFGSTQNLFQNITSYANSDAGIDIDAKSPRNKLYNLEVYYNPVGIQVVDDQTTATTISNGLVYENAVGIGSYNYTTFNNMAVFNNNTGAIMAGPMNILNNVSIFNNLDGLFMQPTLSQSNSFNKVSVYNNTRGIIATSSLNNTYNGLNIFANTTPLVGTNGSDGQLAVTVGYSWAVSMPSILSGTENMTCNRAIQATNASGQNLLQYPYCDTRGLIQSWNPSDPVQYTFFPKIYKQAQAVKYTFPGPVVSNAGTYISTMFVGDFAYVGTTPFGGYMTLSNEGSLILSGGFAYRQTPGTFQVDMYSNDASTKDAVLTGVNDVLFDGVAGWIGTNIFAGTTYNLPGQSLTSGNGLKIFRAGYAIPGSSLRSNYYGQIRGLAAPVCGNNILESGEQCDDLNGGCNISTCTLYVGSCLFQATPSTGSAPITVTFNGVGSTGYLFDYVNYGDGTTGTNLTNHTYTSNGNYTITAYEHNYSSTGLISSCSTQIQLVNPTYCGDGIVQTPNGSGTNEQCDDGNQDPYDGCDNICQPNTCMTTYTPIIEPKFTVVASGWTGDTRIRLNFISTTVGSNLNYAWSIGQYSGSNGLTGVGLTSWNVVGPTNTSGFGLDIQIVSASNYAIAGTINLVVGNGANTGQVQGYMICKNDFSVTGGTQFPGCGIYFAYQAMQYFNGTTATMSDQSIATIITKTGFVRNEVQSTDPSRSNTIPKRWYWNYPTLTPLTTLTGAYVTGSNTYASGYGIIKPYFTRGLTYLTQPDLRKDYAYQQSVFSYSNSCFQTCGNGIVEGSEQCDDGNLIDGDGCGSICTVDPLLCSQITNSATGYAPLTFTPLANPPIQPYRFHSYNISWGNGVSQSGRQGSPYTYTGVGTYTGNVNFNYYDYNATGAAWLDINCPFTVQTVNACGNGIVESISGSITSGTVNYVQYANIYAVTGHQVLNQFGYQTGGLFIFSGGLNTGTALNYQWTLTTGSTTSGGVAFIVGSSTSSSVSIFSNTMAGGSNREGTLTLTITDISGTVVTTQGYFFAYLDGMTVLYPSAPTMSIAGSQVTYSNYTFRIVGSADLGSGDSFYNNTGFALGTGGMVGFDWYGDNIYEYQSGQQSVTYNYAATGSVIHTNISFFDPTGGLAIITTPGVVYQSIALHTTAGLATSGYSEQCDDGNSINGDGCSAQCTFEIPQTCGLSGNLVPNPSLESYVQCPTSYSQFNGRVASWYSPGPDPDYARLGCAYGTGMFSYFQQYPRTGSGAVNILTYASNINNAGREYVGAQLTTPMQIGRYYDVGFCYASHVKSNYLTDKIGMLFSTGAYPTQAPSFSAITQTPQFEYSGYIQGSGWNCLTGTVYADQAYDRFLIGNFHTNTGQNKIPNPNYDGNNFLSYTVSNYLIDDVSVSESCAVCGNGVVEQNEACDDGNADEFDGCTSQCTVNQCQTTLLNKIDPSIIYRRGYLERTAQSTTNIVMDLYTPTVSANYQYQWTLSGINTTGLNTFGFSGSTTTTGAVMVANVTGTSGVNFTMQVGLTIIDGSLSGYMDGLLGCTNSGGNNTLACSFINFNYRVNTGDLQGFTVNGNYNFFTYQQTIDALTPSTSATLTGITVNIGGGGHAYLGLYQTGLFNTVTFGYSSLIYTINSGANDDTIYFNTNTLGTGVGALLSNNVGLQYYNSCLASCGNGILEGSEACDDGNTASGDGCDVQCNMEQRSCNWLTGMTSTGYAPLSVSLGIVPGIYSGYTFDPINRGDGTTGDLLINNTHIYNATGVYTGSIRVRPMASQNAQQTQSYQLTCRFPVSVLSRCGNGVLEQNESCDDGNTNNNDGCTNQCQRTQPTCALLVSPSAGTYPLNVYMSLNIPMGVQLVAMNYGDGLTGLNTLNHTYSGAGLFVPTAIVTNPQNTGLTQFCNGSAITTSQCTNNNQCPGGLVCTNGTCNPCIDNSQCTNGLICLPDGTCGTQQCGDGMISGTEVCDDGNLTGGDGCSATCNLELGCYNTAKVLLNAAITFGTSTYNTGLFDGSGGYIVKLGSTITGTQAVSGYTWSMITGLSNTGYITGSATQSGVQLLVYNIPPDNSITAVRLTVQGVSGTVIHTDGLIKCVAGSGCGIIVLPSASITVSGMQFTGIDTAQFYLANGCINSVCGVFTGRNGSRHRDFNSTGGYDLVTLSSTASHLFTSYGLYIVQFAIGATTGSDWRIQDLSYGQAAVQNGISCVQCVTNAQCSNGLVCLANGTCGSTCGDHIVNGNEQCDGQTNCNASCRYISGGGTRDIQDKCDGEDYSPSYYDGTCGEKPAEHFSAPVGRACKYTDEKYLARGPFTDTLTHRALPYTEMMRASCMWRGRETSKGLRRAIPDGDITRAEALKTFVKVLGVAFDDFTIKTEDAKNPNPTGLADVPQDHWFSWYVAYAAKRGLLKDFVTTKGGKQYLDPDKAITRNESIKLMMVTYDLINKKKISAAGKSVLGDVVDASNPYYQYIRKAEALGFISGVKQKDGTYKFEGNRDITRAEFAKIVSVPFNDQLFDTSALVLNSPVYVAIVKALDKVQGDKIQFVQSLLLSMDRLGDTQFINKFKVTKAIFIQELRNAILPPLYEQASRR